VPKSAPGYPTINFWLAFLDKNKTKEYLLKGLGASPYLVFPHRTETAMVLRQLMAENRNWELKYYLALINLKMDLTEQAIALFNECGDEPGYAPFYLAKAKLATSSAAQLQCLQSARELAPSDWRVLMALANFYLQNNAPEKTLEITGKLKALFPEQASIGMCYAKALITLQKYEECITFLEGFDVLPFEGATVGRDIFHESCLRSALNALEDENYKAAAKYAEKAREWPVNLGVGKPYDVDERMEDYILSLAFEKLGNSKKAKAFAARVTDYSHPGYLEENSKIYLQILLLKSNNKINEAEELLQNHMANYPGNPYLKWVESKIYHKSDEKELEKAAIASASNILPYDTKFVDREFSLLLDFIRILSNN